MHSLSPFFFLPLLLFFLTTSLSDPGPITAEKYALLRFKNSVRSDPAGFLTKWTPNSDHCSFPGVTCSPSRRVVSVNISAGISGEIPGDIWRLEDLEFLYLSGNSLTGALPPSLPPKLRVLNLASNLITGTIPNSLYNSSSLETLNLSRNRLNGSIPGFLQSFPKMREFTLSFNRIGGLIPSWIGNCPSLERLDLSGNLLVGGIPPNLGNCSKLQSLVLSSNLLDDIIPPDLGKLQKLRVLDVSRNSLSGTVPEELGNCSDLSVLVLSNLYDAMPSVNSSFYVDNGEFNNYEGRISEKIASLPNLRILWGPRASLVGKFPQDWGACKSLEMVNLANNFLTGEIPASFNGCKNLKLVNLSSNNMMGRLREDFPAPCLSVLDVSGNKFSGAIPSFIYKQCPLSRFLSHDMSDVYLSFFKYRTHKGISFPMFETMVDFMVYHNFGGNNFSGNLPTLPIATNSFGDQTVYAFLADGNSLVGSLNGALFGKCNYLNGLVINLSKNMMSGEIPADIGASCRSLAVLDVAGNRITGTIPESFRSLGSLVGLDLSMNRLQGPIPVGFGELQGLRYLNLASNNLSGQIPAKLGQLHALNVLDLSLNYLTGEIPGSLVSLKNLSVLLLNNNKLSGEVPSGFTDVTSHVMFNLSYNNLSGSLPSNASTMRCDSVIGNSLLRCWQANSLSIVSSYGQEHSRGLQTYNEPPPESSPTKGGSSRFSSIEIASIASASAILLVLLILIVLFIYTRMFSSCSSADVTTREVSIFVDIGVPLTYESVVQATGNFNAGNCIGSGGFGATYKAEVSPGVLVAIKRLSVGRIQGSQQFHAEIKTLGRWRHPNLVTLIGCHVGEAEMFLIYNYLPGGNLESFIQERYKRAVDWGMLHKIAFDIAKALSYLHNQCVPRILHRDVKPSNILLDNDFNAYLSDFGLARLLGNSETHATTGVAGTFGYVAPEYAMTCRVSDKADVYSYGVVLLELLSDKRALDPSFSPYRNGFNIVAWACMLLEQGNIHKFFAEGLWNVAPHDDLADILNLAITCTEDSLSIRPTMNQVVKRLKELHPPAC